MSVDLSAIPVNGADPDTVDAGRVLRGAMQAPTQRIDRLGNRHSLSITTALMDEEPDGRRWRALLRRAKVEGGLYAYPQLGLRIGAPGSPVVAAEAPVGRTLSLVNVTANYTMRLGQALSVIVEGRRYLYFADAETTASDAGEMTVRLDVLIRYPVPAGATVEIGKPMIEGTVEGKLGGPMTLERATSFSFSIVEDE